MTTVTMQVLQEKNTARPASKELVQEFRTSAAEGPYPYLPTALILFPNS